MKTFLIVTLCLLLAMIAGLLWHGLEEGTHGNQESHVAKKSGRDATGRKNKSSRTPYLVRQLIDPSKHLEEQIEGVRALPSDLTEEEFISLIDILRDPVPVGMKPGRWSTLQNEIMEVLRDSRFREQDYAPAIAGLVKDRNLEPVMRDYAAQHLALYLADPAVPLETFEEGMAAFLFVLEGERESREQVAGTSLMALCDLASQREEDFQSYRKRVSDVVEDFVTGKRIVTLSNRISAIQASGRMEMGKVLPAVRELAQDRQENSSIRLSAISTLGYFADPEDKAFLTEIADGGSRLRFAAQTALFKFN